MIEPSIGSEALRDGAIANKYLLRTRYRAIHADVYLSGSVEPNLQQRIRAAWLWTHRQGWSRTCQLRHCTARSGSTTRRPSNSSGRMPGRREES
jgi:hypothetical protein